MSLILEALRKREREKQVPERGFLVMAPAPWAASRKRGVWMSLVGGAMAFALGVAFMAWRAPRPAVEAPPAAPTAPRPELAPTPVGTLLPARTSEAQAAPVPRAEPGPPEPALPVTHREAEGLPTRTAAIAPAPTPAPRFVLQAISERDGLPVALISDRLMRVGDEWEGARVLRIGDAEVEIEVAGKHVTLHF
jgi:hypothetical protein